ncbi:hypothetical protein L6452_13411 [Arctium lappa]|uniref:Uncharacterized protein n=1 Tax=Arctium lappa TaxID=4217 RepID=A0ACB9CI22_ARCLA|nr:hypothetical protein L6452_13411 [Arctium lappa]
MAKKGDKRGPNHIGTMTRAIHRGQIAELGVLHQITGAKSQQLSPQQPSMAKKTHRSKCQATIFISLFPTTVVSSDFSEEEVRIFKV